MVTILTTVSISDDEVNTSHNNDEIVSHIRFLFRCETLHREPAICEIRSQKEIILLDFKKYLSLSGSLKNLMIKKQASEQNLIGVLKS